MYIVILNNIEKAYCLTEDLTTIPEQHILASKKIRKKKYSHEELMELRKELIHANNK